MSKTVPVTVVIPTMNRPGTLERTLKTYATGDSVPDQIVIVDQTQDEVLRQRVQELANQFCTEYHFQLNPSSTKARNVGFSYARNEIVVYSDDDIDVYPETLDKLYEIMENPQIALIAGLDDNTGVSRTDIGYILGTKSYKKRNIGHVTKSVLGRYPDQVRGTVDTEWAMGYFFAVRNSLIQKWNIQWDERLISYAYAEDLDYSYRYCQRARREGLICILTDQVHVKHMASREYRIQTKKSTYMYALHRRYISDKNHIGNRAAIGWCDFWRVIERTIKKEHPSDLIKAILIANKMRKNEYRDLEETIRGVT